MKLRLIPLLFCLGAVNLIHGAQPHTSEQNRHLHVQTTDVDEQLCIDRSAFVARAPSPTKPNNADFIPQNDQLSTQRYLAAVASTVLLVIPCFWGAK